MPDTELPLTREKVEAIFPWVRHLPDSEVREFIAEIAAWKATAEVHADPDLHRALTTPLDGTDYGPVPEPPAEGQGRIVSDLQELEEIRAAIRGLRPLLRPLLVSVMRDIAREEIANAQAAEQLFQVKYGGGFGA